MTKNEYYTDVKSFMKIGKIDPNVTKIMKDLENQVSWLEWTISTVWMSNSLEKCEALIEMLNDRKKDIEINKLMDETNKANEHKNMPVLDEATKILIDEIKKQEREEELIKDEQLPKEDRINYVI